MSLALLISLFNAQHVSDFNTSILRSLRLMCWVISWVVLLWYDACWCSVVVSSYQSNTTHEITQHISRKLLRMDVLTTETCWALNNEIKKGKCHQVGLSLFNTRVVDGVLTTGMVMCWRCGVLRCSKGIVMFGSGVDGVALCACVVELCVMDYFEQGIFFHKYWYAFVGVLIHFGYDQYTEGGTY